MSVCEIMPGKVYQVGFARPEWDTVRQLGVTIFTDLAGRLEGCPAVIYVSYPFPDTDVLPDMRTLDLMALTTARMVYFGYVSMAACLAGQNRSGLFNALIVRHLLGVSGAVAMRIVREGCPAALNNEAFARYLTDLASPLPRPVKGPP